MNPKDEFEIEKIRGFILFIQDTVQSIRKFKATIKHNYKCDRLKAIYYYLRQLKRKSKNITSSRSAAFIWLIRNFKDHYYMNQRDVEKFKTEIKYERTWI